jgi:antitoxin (DNA-binding transcriptional repressor) of toxin-antitoxin stability system
MAAGCASGRDGSCRNFVALSATVIPMGRDVSIRELRNSTSNVIADLEAGERLTLTVNRRPVADILPHLEEREPWVPSSELRRIVREAPADPGLLADLDDVRGAELDD